jgi:hypothetical protein
MWTINQDPDLEPSAITVADWLEVLRMERLEMPGTHRTLRQDCDWRADPIVSEELVTFLAIECLKRARYQAYVLAN